MSMPYPRLLVSLLAGSMAVVPRDLEAQGVSMTATCSEGWSTLGALGITNSAVTAPSTGMPIRPGGSGENRRCVPSPPMDRQAAVFAPATC